MPPAQPARKRKCQDLIHPYSQKLDAKMDKLDTLLKGMFDLADNDLIIADRQTGINDYDMQYSFAAKLEEVGKQLVLLSNECSKKATDVRENIQKFQDQKHLLQETYFAEEIVKESQKVDEAKQSDPTPYIRDETVLIKREHYPITISDTDSDEEHEVQAGDIDTKFTYRKSNTNEEQLHTYPCEDCDQVFRDSQELRNHQSTHHKELYRCMWCATVCRSVHSFTNHTKTEHAFVWTCLYPDCEQKFMLKTSLMNHEQKHSSFRYTCGLTTCGRQFKYRSTYLEHVNY